MSTDTDRARELQLDDEREQDWIRAALARLDGIHKPPWLDATGDNQEISEEKAA